MFNVDGKEFIFLVLIALVVLGPEKLPDAFRRAGRAYSEFRRISDTFQSEFRKAIDEPTAEFKATTDAIRESFDLRTTKTTHADGSVTETDDGEFTAEEIQRIAEVDLPSFAAEAESENGDTPPRAGKSDEPPDAVDPASSGRSLAETAAQETAGQETAGTDTAATDEDGPVRDASEHGEPDTGVTDTDGPDSAAGPATVGDPVTTRGHAPSPRVSQPARLGRDDAPSDGDFADD